jgi:hypothetical protein
MALLRIAFILSIVVLAVGDVCADEPSFRVTASVNRRTVAVGDTFRLNLDLDWKEGVDVKPLPLGDKVGNFTIRDLSYGLASPEGNRFTRRVSLLLTVFETGEQTVPAVPIIFIDEEGSPKNAETSAIDISVVSVLPEDAAEIRDIKAPISVPRRWKDLILSYSLLIGLAAGAAASVLLSVMRRDQIEALIARVWHRITRPVRRLFIWLLVTLGLLRRGREPAFDVRVTEPGLIPEEAALKELARIEALELLERGMIKEHYTLVSETVRRYLERKYGVLAMESPTSYTLLALSRIELPAEGMGLVGEVLEEGDMVKFAKFVPDVDSVNSIAERARRIVRLTGRSPVPLQATE